MAEPHLAPELQKDKLPANIGDPDRLGLLVSMTMRELQIVFLPDASSSMSCMASPSERQTRNRNMTL